MSKFRVTDPGESFYPKPSDIVYDCAWNKSTAFTEEERRRYGIEGMLPIATETMEVQLQRVYRHVRSFENPLNKYLYLSSLKQRNEVAFFRLLVEHLEELMPIVYTPTVGEACMNFSMLYRATEGFYLSYPQHRGRIRELLNNWPRKRVDIVVVTDGSRILGLGDLGVNGMGIPIGKLSLYVACAGFHPQRVLPVVLDVGTNNERLLADPLYLGNRNSRIADGEFFPFVDEFMSAVRDKWPSCLVQFEDFSNNHCFRLLDLYRHKQLSFNDDIQGTGAVVASAFVNAVRASGLQYRDQRLVFLGAGSAGVGVSDVIARVMAAADGISAAEARRRFWLVDSKGLITKDRGDALNDEKERYARDDNGGKQYAALADIVRYVRPTAIVGLAGLDGGVFTAEILRLMASFSARPVVMALSNPTSKAECTFQEAMDHTGGKAIFASGSPFPAAKVGQASVPNSQANNSYIFPGLGFGAVLAHAREVTDGMLAAATRALAEATTQEEFAEGRILPRLERMREISAIVASAVIQAAFDEGVAAGEMPQDVLEYVRARQFYPSYNEQSPAML